MTTINVKRRDAAREGLRAIKWLLIIAAIFVVGVILFSLSTFTVGEGEQAAVFRLGKVVRVILDKDIVFTGENPDLAKNMGDNGQNVSIEYGKGLHFKWPFIDDVKKYDSRLQTYISQEYPMNTNDKKKYQVSFYAQWRVANPALFYQVYNTMERAAMVLDNTVEPILVQSINNMQATDFLSNKDQLNQSLVNSLALLNKEMRSGGVEVADVQINRTLLPQDNLQSTYDRMVANREKVAQQYRSEGSKSYTEAKAEADLQASKLVADATKQAKEIMGQADAEALGIYADSYKQDEAFYGYWRSLQAMKSSLTHDATVVLGPNSPLWKDLLDMIAAGQITTTAK